MTHVIHKNHQDKQSCWLVELTQVGNLFYIFIYSQQPGQKRKHAKRKRGRRKRENRNSIELKLEAFKSHHVNNTVFLSFPSPFFFGKKKQKSLKIGGDERVKWIWEMMIVTWYIDIIISSPKFSGLLECLKLAKFFLECLKNVPTFYKSYHIQIYAFVEFLYTIFYQLYI